VCVCVCVCVCVYLPRCKPSPGCVELLELLEILEISWNLKLLLEILEISWDLVDAPGRFCNWQCNLYARQAIFSRLYTGTSSGKQDHCDLRRNDERSSELIITCSFTDIANFTCILILYGLSRKNQLKFLKNVSWISSGNCLCWLCTRSAQPCIPPGSLNRVPASAGVTAGMSPLPGGR